MSPKASCRSQRRRLYCLGTVLVGGILSLVFVRRRRTRILAREESAAVKLEERLLLLASTSKEISSVMLGPTRTYYSYVEL
jgi:hypothetical protein